MNTRLSTSTVLTVVGLTWLLAAPAPTEAGRRYDERSLNGAYYYTMIHVREVAPPASGAEYCSGWGTVEFHGDGTALIEGYDRCSVEGTRWNSEAHEYSVSPTGEVLIWPTADPANTTHCQILEKGTTLMCDGVESIPEVLSYHAVAIKE